MSGLDDYTLQRLFDEELEPAEAEEARSSLGEEDASRLASLAQMREILRAEAAVALDDVDLDGIWQAVSARVDAPEPVGAKPAEAAEPAEPDPGLLSRMASWMGGGLAAHPVRWAAAGACVVLAAVLLGVWVGSPPSRRQPPGKAAVKVETGEEVEIEKIEFKGRHPDIFQIKDGKRTTTVIWVYPDDDEGGAEPGDGADGGDPI